MRSLRKPITTSQDLSAGALAFVTTIGRRFKLESVTIHFSEAVTETVTLTRDSAQGANYDTILVKRSLVAEEDFVYRPQGEENFWVGDELKVAITNANVTGTAYVEIKASEVLK